VGVVREHNEDAVLAKPAVGLWAVADGMGGHAVGDVASRIIVEALENIDPKEKLSEFIDAAEDTLIRVNSEMLEYARYELSNATMGSTIALLIIRGNVGACLWAGDSRLYRLRNNMFQQMTRDHSQVEEMIQMGLLSRSEAADHPQSNVITRAVGVEPNLYVEVTAFDTQIGDTFLLCSDGLYGAVAEREIASILAAGNVQQSAQQLIAKSLANGAKDNVSAIVIQGQPGRLSSPENTRTSAP
jgi:serine/threonine protein phosphatase PrpC